MLNWVEMINWRAYDYRKISFGPGITFISGANGTGKTSILEAIAYALIGEPSTVKDRARLLRDPDKPTTVRLSFTIDEQEYQIERSQSWKRAEGIKLVRTTDEKVLASSHLSITSKIQELMGVSTDFLQRIIYMAEGDVFRFLNQPPGESLDLQIRHVLGLTQLDEFVRALVLAEKEIKGQTTVLKELLKELELSGIREGSDLDRHVQQMDTRHERLLADLRSVQDEMTQHARENEDLLRLVPLFNRALPVLQQDSTQWQTVQQTPVTTLFSQLEKQFEAIQATVRDCQTTRARLEGEQRAYQRLLDILIPYTSQAEVLPCPICNKAMTHDEREHITQNIQNSIHLIQEELQNLSKRLVEASRTQETLQKQIKGLSDLCNALAHIHFQSIRPEATIADLQQIVRSQESGFKTQKDTFQQRISVLEQELFWLENERAKSLAIQRRMLGLNYITLEEINETLINLEVRALSLRAASQAAQETLAAHRNTGLKAIYDQVSRLWEVFMGEEGWHVQLNTKGMPVLEDRRGHQFDLSQFSGGEKTALLVMLHIVIAHHFSKIDFLLIDEPLEHLDPINRRALIRFLVSAYRHKSFQQAIVTTFEETLIRKYMAEEGLHVIHCEAQKV
jgi:exonuclease SbcC